MSSAVAGKPLRTQARALIEALVRPCVRGRCGLSDRASRCARKMRKDVLRIADGNSRASGFPSDQVHAFGTGRRTAVAARSRSARRICSIRITNHGRPRCSARSIARSRILEKAVQRAVSAARGARRTPAAHEASALGIALPFANRWLDMPAEPTARRCSTCQECRAKHSARRNDSSCRPAAKRRVRCNYPAVAVDHPLSPFYGAGHADWARGEPTPLLPGEAKHTLTLRPTATLSQIALQFGLQSRLFFFLEF